MKSVLQASGVWQWVSGEKPAPTDPEDYTDWKRIDVWVLYRLQSSIEDECFLWSESTEGLYKCTNVELAQEALFVVSPIYL